MPERTAELFATDADQAVYDKKVEVLRIMLDWDEDIQAAGTLPLVYIVAHAPPEGICHITLSSAGCDEKQDCSERPRPHGLLKGNHFISSVCASDKYINNPLSATALQQGCCLVLP